ncbi:hypothetical protein WAI453_003762 [Rhynchosporium graminicola]
MGASISTRRHFGPLVSSVNQPRPGEDHNNNNNSEHHDNLSQNARTHSGVERSENGYAYAYGLGGVGRRSRSIRRVLSG